MEILNDYAINLIKQALKLLATNEVTAEFQEDIFNQYESILDNEIQNFQLGNDLVTLF